MQQHDEYWMQCAIQLAERGRFGASPNPLVGACVVKGKRLISGDFHRKFGEAHAEVRAIQKAGKSVKGATLYVTLEPCSSFGKTPPCLDLILKSKIKRVVIGLIDPNPKHKGKAIRLLREAGISVTTGVLSGEVAKQNESFLKWMKTKTPFVTLKMAQSLDGKIATRTGKAKWISGPQARDFVQELRAEQDAILVGKNTLLKDNPSLTVRGKHKRLQQEKPWRIAIDPKNAVRSDANILKGKQQTVIAISEKNLAKVKAKKKGKAYIAVPEKKGRLDLKYLMQELGGLGVSKLLVEGGGELAWEFLDQKLVDKLYWIVAPKIIGGRDAVTSVEGKGVNLPPEGESCKIENVYQMGDDFVFEARVKK